MCLLSIALPFWSRSNPPNNAIQLALRTTAVCFGHFGDVILMSSPVHFEPGN